MKLHKSLLCLAIAAASPLIYADSCEVGQGCGLSGARGAMEDESLLQRRAGGLGDLPALPQQGERELPRERLVLWHLPDQNQQAAGVLTLNPDEPQILQTALQNVQFESGRSVLPDDYTEQLWQVMERLKDKNNVRLRIIGHTDPQRLSARAASIYTDNYGLGLDRARQVALQFKAALNLSSTQVDLDSRGPNAPIASNATAEGMAINRRVEVEIWYDEPAQQNACSGGIPTTEDLAPFRISVDGQPVGDHSAGVADQQRCVDVALAENSLKVRYDNLSAQPRLNVAAAPRMAVPGQTHYFRGYSNYMNWVERGEVQIFGKPSRWGQPELLETVELDPLLNGEWLPSDELPDELYYRLRVYDAEGRFDDTDMQPLQLTRGEYEVEPGEVRADLLAVTGGNRLQRHRIPVAGGTVTVNGQGVQPGYAVFVMGDPVPVDPQGNFATAQIIPRGEHSVEVALLDPEGQGRIYRRDLRLPERDWFTVAIADITIGQQDTSGPAQLVTGEDRYYDDKVYVDGRLAFYTKGKIDGKYTVTASIDTGEEPIDSLFSNFNDKNPREFLRRMDANRHWATFGDDSTLVEDAPTQGKGYVRVEDGKSHAMWGNFEQHNRDTELSQIDRRLYGAQARYQGDGFTAFGERKVVVEGFAAEPGTASAREEFLGTGGSLYFLRNQDIASGSEALRVEIRDKHSGLVLMSEYLSYGIDYEIDPIQGRILLNRPLSAMSDDNSVVRSGGSLSGNPAYLVVTYEYSPGFESMDDLAVGGRASVWANDSVRIGVTASSQEHFGQKQDQEGIDLTLRHSDRTWLKLETARTEGEGIEEQISVDGGFGFNSRSVVGGQAYAERIDGSLDLSDVGIDGDGQLTFYHEERDAGFNAPGRLTSNDTRQSGVALVTPLSEQTDLILRADETVQSSDLENQSAEVGISHQLDEEWTVVGGYRSEERTSAATSTANEGRRDDLAVQLEYAPEDEPWTAHGFVQGTVKADGNREDNNRLGVGGSYRVNDRINLMGEISDGDLGLGAKAGVDYASSDRTNLYLNYELDNDRTDQGIGSRMGQVVTGARSRWSDTTSVYAEQRYQHGSQQTGLVQGYGVDFAPDDHWTYGLSTDIGHLNSETDNEIRRRAVSGSVGYRNEDIRYAGALEYRKDRYNAEERTVWLLRNNLSYQIDPDWRMIGHLDMAIGDSSQGSFFDGNFVEASLGYAYRPVLNDRWNTLVKYTYLSDLAPAEQRSSTGNLVDYSQRSHVFAIDSIYDLTERWSLGGRYAYRLGELRMSRDDSADWFSSKGQLIAVRADWHVVHKWDLMVELRRRDEFTAEDSRTGAVLAAYRHFGNNMKAGVGYNFSDFSDDLTDMDFRSQGWFINIIGKY
ncbi:OmpA family protein [Nitrincola iocasae]|uniref:OmpA family protein n=1 Tax=Nitrincola iocasae TaxID=2614693 RepID=A0A5J6LBD3_9GAMM|nr:OmpA family protein [Nitrincola iocasae]QEW05919.1 OmpA family protein [Nitrincola iocasae]